MTTNRYEISFWSKRHILKLAQGNGYEIIETVSRNDTKQNPLPGISLHKHNYCQYFGLYIQSSIQIFRFGGRGYQLKRQLCSLLMQQVRLLWATIPSVKWREMADYLIGLQRAASSDSSFQCLLVIIPCVSVNYNFLILKIISHCCKGSLMQSSCKTLARRELS